MKINLSCPHASYDGKMRIMCQKAGNICAHQYFRQCKGWFALTQAADNCPLRKEQSNEKKTGAKRTNRVSDEGRRG